jgi:hypothetical protein
MLRTPLILAAAIGAILTTTQLSRANEDICVRMQDRLDQLNSDVSLDDYEFNLRRDRLEAALDANNCPVMDHQRRDVRRYDDRNQPSYEILGEDPDYVDPEQSRRRHNYATMGDPREPPMKELPKPVIAAKPAEPVKPSQPAKQEPAIASVQPEPPMQPKSEPAPSAVKPAEAAQPAPAVAAVQPQQPLQPKAEPAPAKPDEKQSSIIQLGEPAPTKAEAPLPQPLSDDKPIDPNRKVRVVGPTFLPDQAGAINLRAPGQKTTQ